MTPVTPVRTSHLVLVLLLVLAAAGCSPEATRVRGGGPGADVGNHVPGLATPSTAPPTPGQ
jgi:hypothetical protein